jgi:hypothetical protein
MIERGDGLVLEAEGEVIGLGSAQFASNLSASFIHPDDDSPSTDPKKTKAKSTKPSTRLRLVQSIVMGIQITQRVWYMKKRSRPVPIHAPCSIVVKDFRTGVIVVVIVIVIRYR